MFNRIRQARQRVAEFHALSAEAQPGETWTCCYIGKDIHGNEFTAWITGTVRILGEECPVAEYRGRKTLGELDLDPFPFPFKSLDVLERLRHILKARKGYGWTLTRGDWMPYLTWEDVTDADGGALLRDLPSGITVAVEYRSDHPVYEGLRNVVTGVLYDEDERGGEKGRDVGGDWVPYNQVRGITVHESTEQVA